MTKAHIHHPHLRPLVRSHYTPPDLRGLLDALTAHGVFGMTPLPNGLFAAARVSGATSHTGYQHVWVRDNVYVAHAHRAVGRPGVAAGIAVALMRHFRRQLPRIRAVIADPTTAEDVQRRPHVKFDGERFADIPGDWSHAQNDALGGFLWLYAGLAARGLVPLGSDEAEVILAVVEYFRAIRYQTDADSGHWEEDRRVLSSSVGAVVAGLSAVEQLTRGPLGGGVTGLPLADLIIAGRLHLSHTLPAECLHPHPAIGRTADAATLFLIYPFQVVDDFTADRILAAVHTHLQGDYGIRRYAGDSFWCDDYFRRVRPDDRTRDYSQSISDRNSLLSPGGEAQWCIFDPIVSVVYGRKFRASGDPADLAAQTHHFNRSVGQLTGPLCRCGFDDPGAGIRATLFNEYLSPELYHRERMPGGEVEIQPSEATPLLWAQANLMIAAHEMARSCGG